MVDYRTYPGAVTPFSAINQLLELDERLVLEGPQGRGYLLAPKSSRSLSALLFLLKQHQLSYSQLATAHRIIRGSIYLSVQYLQQIDLLQHDVVEVQGGCSLEALALFLHEQKFELGLENLISPKQLVGEAILAGSSCGLFLRQMSVQDRLLAVELVKPGGGIVRLGTPIRGAAAGPELHQCIWGINQMESILIKAAFRIDPIPPVRLHAAWSFECHRSLWEQFSRLSSFSSHWERLDCMISHNLNEKSFIVSQISGLPEEMEAFKKSCPSFSAAKERALLKEFLAYFKEKKALFKPLRSQVRQADYIWHHGLTGDGWEIYLNDPESPDSASSTPLWKERVLSCLGEQ